MRAAYVPTVNDRKEHSMATKTQKIPTEPKLFRDGERIYKRGSMFTIGGTIAESWPCWHKREDHTRDTDRPRYWLYFVQWDGGNCENVTQADIYSETQTDHL